MFSLKSITVRVSDDLRDLIAKDAEVRGRTLSDHVRQLLEAHSGQIDPIGDRAKGSVEIDLTLAERKIIILAHQALLAAKGDLPEEMYDKESLQRSVKALQNGYEGEFSRIFGDVVHGLSLNECELVWDILDMFRVINGSVQKMGDDGWQSINVEDADFWGTFRGFDFQHKLEGRLAGYVEYLVNSGRWLEQQSVVDHDGGNSHTEMLPTYQAMLARFKPVWREAISRGRRPHLSAEEIGNVLLAAPGARLKKK